MGHLLLVELWVAGDLSRITAFTLASFLHAVEEWLESIIHFKIMKGGIFLVGLGNFEVDHLQIVSLVRVDGLIQILSVGRGFSMYSRVIEDSCEQDVLKCQCVAW